MDSEDVALPTAIARFVETTNRARTEEFLDLFTADATLTDWDRTVRGRDGIRSWNLTDNIGVRTYFTPEECVETGVGAYRLTVRVTGKGYQGASVMVFRLDGDQIADLTIPEPTA